jgi:hypothetical protein
MDAAGYHFAVVAPMDHVRKTLRIAGVETTLRIRDAIDAPSDPRLTTVDRS